MVTIRLPKHFCISKDFDNILHQEITISITTPSSEKGLYENIDNELPGTKEKISDNGKLKHNLIIIINNNIVNHQELYGVDFKDGDIIEIIPQFAGG